MAELPSGTVTFLFTDIEGSTRLLKQLGERYGDLLADHQRILRDAFAANAGHEIDTQGDSFFVAFRRAKDAVASAVDAQRALAAHEWPENEQCKVRMGLHSGEPVVGEQRYTGLGVHRAARIAAAGHGGQVLVSEATRSLVEDDLPAGVTLRDLGRVQLKDLDRPERIYQLVIERLPGTFPRLKTHGKPPLYRRRSVLAGALAGVIAAAVAIPIFALGQGSGGGVSVDGNAVAVIDPGSNRVTAQVPVGARPGAISYGAGALWVANQDDQTVSRVDPSTRQVTRSIALPATPTGLAATAKAVWVAGAVGGEPYVELRKIDPQFGSIGEATKLGNVFAGGPGYVAADGESVWAAPSSGLLASIDPQTGRPKKTVDPASGPGSIAVSGGAVWVTDADGNSVTRVDSTGLVTPIPVGNRPSAVAVDGSGVWVPETLDNAVARIDPSTRAVTANIPVGQAPTGIAIGGGAVWVANSRDGTVSRIDPAANTITKTISVGGSPQSLVFADGRLWVTVDREALADEAAAGSGRTLRLTSEVDSDYLDPALAFSGLSWQILNATCARLLNYPDKPAPAGGRLEPEVAKSLPTRSPDGKTYTFTIRRGFRFSPPSNEPVTAQTFKFAIERTLSPQMKSPGATFLADVVGADAYVTGKAAHISGVVAHGDTLSIHLTEAAPDFVSRIALPFFCAVPPNTPLDPNGVRTVPAAGPYYVSSYTPGQGAILLRNPNYHGGRPHHFDRMLISLGLKQKTADAQIAAGKIDFALDTIDASDRARLAARYGPGSAAARKGRQQFFTSTQPAVEYLLLNTTRGIFTDARLRRAANIAIDRAAIVAGGSPFGGAAERLSDEYLPPGLPGYTGRRLFPPHGDIAAARRLAGGTRRSALMYTCDKPLCARLGQIVKTDLARIGISVDVRQFPLDTMFSREVKPGEPYDIGIAGWVADYLDPSDFLNKALATRLAGPGFDDPVFSRRLAHAASLSGPRRYLTYGRLSEELARESAPWIVFGNPTGDNFFSPRIGCQINQPASGIDLAALCLRR